MQEPKGWAYLITALRNWAGQKGGAEVQLDLTRAQVRYLLHLYDARASQ